MTVIRQFGRNLFMARRRMGVTQETLSVMAGPHRGTVNLLEGRHRSPRLPTIVALADALGIDPGELLMDCRRDRRQP